MKAPVFSNSLDDMKAVSHFYTSPLLPLWPLPLARPPFGMRRPACPRITGCSRSLNWFVRMTALASTLTQSVRILRTSHRQPGRPSSISEWKGVCFLRHASPVAEGPLLSGNRFRPLPLATAPDAVYENGAGIKWFRDANIWPEQWSMWAFSGAPPNPLIYGADRHLFWRTVFSDAHQSSLSG